MSVFDCRQICKMAGSKDRSRKRTSGIFFIGKKIPKILVPSSSPTHTDTDTVGHASRRRCSTQHVFHSFNSQTYLHIWESGMHFGYLVVCWSLYCAWISNRTWRTSSAWCPPPCPRGFCWLVDEEVSTSSSTSLSNSLSVSSSSSTKVLLIGWQRFRWVSSDVSLDVCRPELTTALLNHRALLVDLQRGDGGVQSCHRWQYWSSTIQPLVLQPHLK